MDENVVDVEHGNYVQLLLPNDGLLLLRVVGVDAGNVGNNKAEMLGHRCLI